MDSIVSWYRTTFQLSFPFGILIGVVAEMPVSVVWGAWVVALFVLYKWIASCKRLGVQQFFKKHKNCSGFERIGSSVLWLFLGGLDAGSVATQYLSRGYLGSYAVGIPMAVGGLVYGVFLYSSAIALVVRVANPQDERCA